MFKYEVGEQGDLIDKILATKSGQKLLVRMQKTTAWLEAIKSPLGQELLRADMAFHDFLAEKAYHQTLTGEEAVLFDYLKKRITVTSERVLRYTEDITALEEAGIKQKGGKK